MFKNPNEFAEKLLDCFFGSVAETQREMFNQARSYSNVPCAFWRDAYNALPAIALRKYGPGGSSVETKHRADKIFNREED